MIVSLEDRAPDREERDVSQSGRQQKGKSHIQFPKTSSLSFQ